MDIRTLASDLYQLANSTSSNEEDNGEDDDEEEDDDDESEAVGTEVTEETGDSNAIYPEEGFTDNTLHGVVSIMLKGNKISSAEASCLIDLIKAKDEFIMAAYDLYRHDNDLDELKDTLMRCARLQIRRKVVQQQEDQLANQMGVRGENYDTDDDDDDDDDDDEDDEDNEVDDIKDYKSLEELLESVSVENTWKELVPDR